MTVILPLVSKISKNTFWLDLRKKSRKENLRKYLRKLRGGWKFYF